MSPGSIPAGGTLFPLVDVGAGQGRHASRAYSSRRQRAGAWDQRGIRSGWRMERLDAPVRVDHHKAGARGGAVYREFETPALGAFDDQVVLGVVSDVEVRWWISQLSAHGSGVELAEIGEKVQQ